VVDYTRENMRVQKLLNPSQKFRSNFHEQARRIFFRCDGFRDGVAQTFSDVFDG